MAIAENLETRPAVVPVVPRERIPIPVFPGLVQPSLRPHDHLGWPLSPRQREVLLLSANGLSESQISLGLGIAVETVKNHRLEAKRKLGVPSLSDAIVSGIKTGDISAESIEPVNYDPSRLGSLSDKQRQIYLAIIEDNGFVPYKEIAPRFGIAEQTLRNLCGKIFRKLGIHSRRQALAVYIKTNSAPSA